MQNKRFQFLIEKYANEIFSKQGFLKHIQKTLQAETGMTMSVQDLEKLTGSMDKSKLNEPKYLKEHLNLSTASNISSIARLLLYFFGNGS